jgi:hypothetical protein
VMVSARAAGDAGVKLRRTGSNTWLPTLSIAAIDAAAVCEMADTWPEKSSPRSTTMTSSAPASRMRAALAAVVVTAIVKAPANRDNCTPCQAEHTTSARHQYPLQAERDRERQFGYTLISLA